MSTWSPRDRAWGYTHRLEGFKLVGLEGWGVRRIGFQARVFGSWEFWVEGLGIYRI